MNILTFDIEEWSIQKERYGNNPKLFYEYDHILDEILSSLAQNDIQATFFCLGKIAIEFPDVIKKIAAAGHEIGCHSHAHRWINKMTPDEFRLDTYAAVSAIEDLIGRKIESYRAPAFSIGESSKWAFEILAENGIKNDSSVFPGVRDFGGFPGFSEHNPCIISYNGIHINEFPIPLCNIPIVNKQLAYSGGGYFRLLPLWFVKRRMCTNDYNICYFHIADMISEKEPMMTRKAYESYFKEDGPLIKRMSRYFKSNVGRAKTLTNVKHLLTDLPFTSIDKYLMSGSITKEVLI